MCRTRLIVPVVLAVALLAGACGGGGDDEVATPGEDNQQAQEFEQQQEPEAAGTAPADTPAAVDVPEPPPRLGNRFEWCAELQAIWDDDHAAQLRLSQAIDTETAALQAWQATTDDLDKAEAAVALDAAREATTAATTVAEDATWAAMWLLPSAEAAYHDSTSSPEVVAFSRAWQAFADNVGDAYLDAVDALEEAAAAEALATSQEEQTRRDVEERRQSEYPESMLTAPADTVMNAAYRLASATYDLNFFFDRASHAAVHTAWEALWGFGDTFRNYVNGVFGSSADYLVGYVTEIGSVIDAAHAANSEVRGIVPENRLAEYDALVAVFDQDYEALVGSSEAFVEAANVRAAGLAALDAEQDAAHAALVAASETHKAAANAKWGTLFESVHTAAYAAFQESLLESCA